MRLSAPIYRLKRNAKRAARSEGITLHAALDRAARLEGYRSWSHLAAEHAATTPAKSIYGRLAPGDLVLLAARPGHGKTLLGLKLAEEASRSGAPSIVFTLEYTEAQMRDLLGPETKAHPKSDPGIEIDTSDTLSADHIGTRLSAFPGAAFAVVDYMQLLDQRRTTPPLQNQVAALRACAKDSGSTIILISQVDRTFDDGPAAMPTLGDIRLPNPVDLTLFDKACFLHDGEVRLEPVG